MEIDSLQSRDARSVVHWLTNLSLHATRGATVIESGQGVWVRDSQGKDYLEAMSGLWCIALGYGNKRLADTAHRQMQQLAYYPPYKSQEPPASHCACRETLIHRTLPNGKGLVCKHWIGGKRLCRKA